MNEHETKKIRIDGIVKVFADNDAVFVYAGSTPDNTKSVVLKDFAKDNSLCNGEYKASLSIDFHSKPDDMVSPEDIRIGNTFMLYGPGLHVRVTGFEITDKISRVFIDNKYYDDDSVELSGLRAVRIDEKVLSGFGFRITKEHDYDYPEAVLNAYCCNGNKKIGIVIRQCSHGFYLSVNSIDRNNYIINTEITGIHIIFIHQLQNIIYDNYGIRLKESSDI